MPFSWKCPQGHHWDLAADGSANGGALVCPVCGAAGQPCAFDPAAESPTLPPPAPADGQSGADAPVLAPPTLAGYEILGELGRGSMGVVYRARQLSLNRVVALKMILAGFHAGRQEVARFRMEAEAAARLQHPNIVQIHEVGEAEGRPFFSLEYVEGGSLAERLQGTPLAPRQAAQLVETLARAVHQAHLQGIVHRDLKPANVLLTSDGRPKITDFGLAKRLGDASSQTASGAVMGTPSYMAPEQAGGRTQEIGPATDVYALGTILYELLTGRPPFKAASLLETVRQVVEDEPARPTELQSRTPRDLETITLKCLEKAPARRYASAQALAEDLARFLSGEPILARPTPAWERALKWTRRRPTAAALIGVTVAALLSLLAGGWYFTQQLQDERVRAEAERDGAQKERDRAREQADYAREQHDLAKKEKAYAVLQTELARRHLYAAQLVRVAGFWERDPSQGKALLEDTASCPPEFRDFTWGFFSRLCNRERRNWLDPEPVRSVAFSPDGTTVAVASSGTLALGFRAGRVRLWDARTGVERAALAPPVGGELAVAFRPDGRLLASAGQDGKIKLWDVATGRQTRTLGGHASWVNALAFSPDGRTLASGSADRTIKLWDVETGQARRTLRGHQNWVTSLAFSPDGRSLVSGSWDTTVTVWDLAAEGDPQTLRGPELEVTAVAISRDGQLVAAAARDRSVRLWDLKTLRERATLLGHTRAVFTMAFSPDGKWLASGGEDSTVKVWEVASGRERTTLTGHAGAVHSVAFSPDGRTLVSGGEDHQVRLWNWAPDWAEFTLEEHTGGVNAVAFWPDGRILASGSHDRSVILWDVASGKSLGIIRGDRGEITAVAFDPHGRTLAWGSREGAIKLWDLTVGQELRTLSGHGGGVQALAFSPDGRTIASGGRDGRVRLWETETGGELRALPGHTDGVPALAFSPDGRLLAASYGDGWERPFHVSHEGFKLWELATGKELHNFRGHRDDVLALAFSPDGQTLASGGLDQSIKIWDVATATERLLLRGHALGVKSLAFSPDGRTLASGSGDPISLLNMRNLLGAKPGEVKLWDPVTGQERASLPGHASAVLAVAFSPDGRTLASGSWDRTVKLWTCPAPLRPNP